MKISEAAKQSGLTNKAIRFYESMGLVECTRLANGYRDYSDSDIQTMRFIHRARDLGFSIEECRYLVCLQQNSNRASATVKQFAQDHLQDITQQIEKLQEMKAILENLISHCPGDDNPQCSIIDELEK
ncbi:MAG: Cu(I)-responsive transcriptional regulator [Pseudomonadota bacterium]